MKKLLLILLAVALAMPATAQTRKTTRKKATTTRTVKRKTTRKATTKKKTATPKYTNKSIKNLEGQRSSVRKKIRQQEQALRSNKANVRKKLQDLMLINTAIDEKKRSIDTIQNDIQHLDGNISLVKSQLSTLEAQLKERQRAYVKSMRYLAVHRSVQDKLMFIFSADNFAQMYRRLRFVRQYAAYQRAQGERVKAKQAEIDAKNRQLQQVRSQKNNLLYKGKQAHAALQTQQGEQQQQVADLQKQQKTIQAIIAEQRKKDAALNAQIDAEVAKEVAKARARAAAEAKRKAAEAAAAAKKRAEELARRKAEAERARIENERRIAEAKAREERLKQQAEAARRAEAEAKARAQAQAEAQKREQQAQAAREAEAARQRIEQQAREAEAARLAAERKAEAEKERNAKAIETVKKKADEAGRLSSVDRMMSGGFEANKGRLPMPITGGYRIVSHFGQYNVEGLKNVTLDNKGINILGSPGSKAKSIYDGEVSAIFGFGGTMVVMVRHGIYISVYSNLSSVNVSKGQKVSTGQVLGSVGKDNILQFQLRKETAKLNPEAWLR